MMLLSPLLIPLLTALACAALAERARARQIVSLAGSLLFLVAALGLLAEVASTGRLSVALGNWPLPHAIEFAADGLSAAFVLVAALLGLVVQLYRLGASRTLASPWQDTFPHGLLASVAAVFLAADLFNLYVWFELMLICGLGLLVLGGERRHLEAAFKYFVLSMLGTLLLLAAVALIHGVSGHLNFSALRAAAVPPGYVGLLLLALLLKAGAFPLFAWLPASYHTLPIPMLALVGGLLTKVAAYVMLRLFGEVFVLTPAWLLEALGWLAIVTMLVGVFGAAYHWDLRRILAFHIVSQIGYLMFGVALASPAGAAGVAYFMAHNILVKANLFLIAGMMWHAAGHHDLRHIGGLYLASPVLALLFLVSAFSLVGVPPSSGFWGKFLLLREAFAQGRFVWGGLALAVGLLTLYSMSKIWVEGFWKPHPAGAAALVPIPVAAYVAVTLLSVCILVLGLLPEPFIHYAGAATAAFHGGGEP